MVDKPTVLVTGCSRGLGFSLVKALVAKGYDVLAGVRDEASIQHLPDGTTALKLDVTKPDDIEQAVTFISEKKGELFALINNAGTHVSGPIEMTDPDAAKLVFDVNFWGALNITRALLPIMRKQGHGHIISVSSLSGLAALPSDGIYAASKHALEAAMESLSHEVARFGIGVTTVQPGGFQSDLISDTDAEDVFGAYQHLEPSKDTNSANLPSADDIAQEIIALLERKQNELRVPVGDQAKLIACKLRSFDQKKRFDFIQNASGLS